MYSDRNRKTVDIMSSVLKLNEPAQLKVIMLLSYKCQFWVVAWLFEIQGHHFGAYVFLFISLFRIFRQGSPVQQIAGSYGCLIILVEHSFICALSFSLFWNANHEKSSINMYNVKIVFGELRWKQFNYYILCGLHKLNLPSWNFTQIRKKRTKIIRN